MYSDEDAAYAATVFLFDIDESFISGSVAIIDEKI